LDQLVLRDILKTACNITNATYKEVGGWERGGRGWRGRAGGLTMPSDTGDQAVCIVGQTVGHSSPDITISHADVQ